MRGGAVVTGAGSGVGKQLARLLVQPEHLVLVTDVNGDAARGTAAELGPQAVPRNVDVRDHRQLEAARDEIVALAGSLDVACLGSGRRCSLAHARGQRPRDDQRHRRGHRGDAPCGRGHVVNIASLAALTPVPGEAV